MVGPDQSGNRLTVEPPPVLLMFFPGNWAAFEE